MPDHVDAVARALMDWQEPNHRKGAWDFVPEEMRDEYRSMAETAIEAHTTALQLTEERRIRIPGGVTAAQIEQCRLVSPWVAIPEPTQEVQR